VYSNTKDVYVLGNTEVLLLCMCVYNTFYGSGFTTLIRFNYWILCETVLPGQGSVPRLAEVDFTDTVVKCNRTFFNVFNKTLRNRKINIVKQKDIYTILYQ
jgi:hypothetical protein